MIQEPELEEGETCYYKDDTSIDPDVALSYIGDKVQSILGHLQKDFEGGVSAENLGAKFGGYGSFLPTHQRSPSIWSQPKSPHKVHNSHSPRSPNACPEGPTPNSVMVSHLPSTQRDVSQALKFSFDDGSMRQKANVSSDKVAEVLPPSSKLDNPPDQRTLKVRIKVGPERVAQYNAEIYNLGLTSPSSSEGNSHDKSDGLLVESHETSNGSPANILKVMTSFPVSGGLLLSPLCEDLLNLARKTENSVESKFEAAPKNSAASIRLLNNNVSGGKKTKFVNKSGNTEKPEDEVANHNDCKQKTFGGENIESSVQPFHELNRKPLPDSVRETDNDVHVKRRKRNEDWVKERAVSGNSVKDIFLDEYAQRESRCSSVEKIGENRARISQKDVSVDHVQGSKNRVKENHAPLKAYSDNSEGEGVKRTMDNWSLKAGPNATSSTEHNISGIIPHAVNRLSFEGEKRSQGSLSTGKLASKADGLRNGDSAAQEDKYSGKKGTVRRLHLSKKDVVRTSLENMENPKPKNFNPDAVKAKPGSSDKLMERFSKKCFDKVSYDALIEEPPPAAIHSKEGIVNGLKQTVAPPILIEENWVACDRCEKWRLLPSGTKSEDLPDKWMCGMLDWLPGMNHCDISEDETTKALQASYPENQHNFQAHTDGTMAGVISSDEHLFNRNHKNCASDQMKKQKLKEKRNTVSMRDSVLSNGKMKLQRLAARNESSKVVKQSFSGVNATTNHPDIQLPNKSTVVSEKPNKRKGEHVIGDEANMRKKIKIESAQHVHGKLKKIKSKDAVLTVDNFQTSGGHLGGMNGHNSTSAFPDKADMKDGKKKSTKKTTISGCDFRISVKKHTDQMQHDLPDNGPSGMKTCNVREVASKKIKLKNYEYSLQINESNLQDRKVSLKEESKDGDFHKDAKSRVSQGDASKRKSDEARFQSSGSKEYPINRVIEKEQQVRKPKAKVQLTIEDIVKLRQDLGCEQPSTAATSSSSKVSGSRKNRINYMKPKGSPGESVCSSPVRMPYPNHVSPMVEEAVGKIDSKEIRDMNESSELAIIARKGISDLTNDNGSEIFDSRNKLKEETDFDNHSVQKHEVSSNVRHPSADGCSVKSVKKGTSIGKKDFGKLGDNNDVKSSHDSPKRTVEKFSAKMEPWNGKLHIDLRQGDKQGALGRKKQGSGLSRSVKRSSMDSRPLDASIVDNTSRDLKETADVCFQNVTDNCINNEVEQSVALEASLGKPNAISTSTTSKEAEVALREAEELRVHADLIKNSGFSSESNYEYFKAALKFLHGASLLETCNGVSNKHLEMSPMQMYGAAAQLYKTCASEYEKSHEMAAAALAYKCMEVAYLRVVYCKSSNTSRVWHDLQMDPQGESPSSSASDVDNLNNLVMMDKVTLSKGGSSHPGSQVMVPLNCLNFVRLLDFTKDINDAMDAAKKSQDTFAAARVELEQSQNKEAIFSVKRVIDFSFQDVEELVRLVSLAFNTINHQGLSGSRD